MKELESAIQAGDEPLAGWAFLRRFVVTVAELSTFAARSCRVALSPPWNLRELDTQLYEVGWRSSILVLLVGLAIGMTIAQFITVSLANFGSAEEIIPTQLSKMMFRQLGPLITGLLVSGRIGAAMTAELGVLGLTGQIDRSLKRAAATDRHLIGTRMAACGMALPILSLLMCFSEIFGGYLWESAQAGTSLTLYFGRVFTTVSWMDFMLPTLPMGVAGIVIAIISCYFGYTADSTAAGIRRASMQSVVVCCLFVVALNLLFTQLLFVWLPGNAR